MKQPSKFRSLAATLVTIGLLAGGANGATHFFSFTSDGSASTLVSTWTDVGGPVTGTITLPDGDGTFLPTSVIIDGFPPAHGNNIEQGLDATSWDIQAGTGFTVSGGLITGANWVAQSNGFTSSDPLLGFDQIRFNFLGLNLFTLSGEPGQITLNDDGFAGVTYASSPIPEPSSALLFGLGALGLFVRRRRA